MTYFTMHRYIVPAIFISYAPLLLLAFSAAGIQGSSYATAAMICTGLLGSAVAMWSPDHPNWVAADTLFAVFAGSTAISFAVNPFHSDIKGVAMLVIALSCYPAGRLIRLADVGKLRRAVLIVSAIVVVAGVGVTTWTLLLDLDNPSRSVVLNFEHAATVFAASLGFYAIAFAHGDEQLNSKIAICHLLLIALAAVVFSAAMVRFMFLAMLLALVVSMVFKKFKRKAICAGVLLIGTLIGQSVRHEVAVTYIQQTISAATSETASSCAGGPDMRNSIEIRKSLTLDAIRQLPSAGPFGHGLDSFDTFTCLKGFGPHNAVLQAVVELGWIPGVAFISLLVLICYRLAGVARRDTRVSFLLTLFGFQIAISLVHGRLNQSFQLFLFMGLAAAAAAQLQSREKLSDR